MRLARVVVVAVTISASARAVMAKEKSLWQRRFDWGVETTVKAYERVGQHDPRWDGPAHELLFASARLWNNVARQTGDEETTMWGASWSAIESGCRDPLVVYARTLAMMRVAAPEKDVAKVAVGMPAAFRKSEYPAIRKMYGYWRAGQIAVAASPDDEGVRKRSHALLEEGMTLLPEVLKDPRLPGEELDTILSISDDVCAWVERDRLALRERIIAAMERSPQPRSAVLAARGARAVEAAWGARGGGWAHTVPAEGWKVMGEELAKARELLEEAWKLDDKNYFAALTMLTVELGAPTGRAAMEQWFDRAVAIDSDDPRAYDTKLLWLEPKWHGSKEEMLAFGRECAESGPWIGLVPLRLVDAHWDASKYGAGGYGKEWRRKYFESNPQVWEEIRPVYDEYLKQPRVSSYHKTRFGLIAAYSGQWKESDRMFKSVPKGWLSQVWLYDEKMLNEVVKEAEEKAKEMGEGK